jgi:hypothetical protein
MANKKFFVELDAAERARLTALISKGKSIGIRRGPELTAEPLSISTEQREPAFFAAGREEEIRTTTFSSPSGLNIRFHANRERRRNLSPRDSPRDNPAADRPRKRRH